MAAPYGDPDRLFIAELGGRIVLRTAGQNHEFINLDPIVLTGGEQGLLSVAVAPDYAASGRVFVFYNDNAGNLALDVLRRSGSDPNTADPSTRRNVMTIAHSQADNHNGGQLQFGSDGYLYLSTGDGGTQGDPEGDAQSLGSLLGKILRIDVDPAPGAPPPLAVAGDTRAPRLRARVKRRQRVLKLRGAVARASCDERCTISRGRRAQAREAKAQDDRGEADRPGVAERPAGASQGEAEAPAGANPSPRTAAGPACLRAPQAGRDRRRRQPLAGRPAHRPCPPPLSHSGSKRPLWGRNRRFAKERR